jgi:hypothetical protein
MNHREAAAGTLDVTLTMRAAVLGPDHPGTLESRELQAGPARFRLMQYN